MDKCKRKSIPNSVRFEVFKRDSFTCQYCGRSSPSVILEVEHIKPVSKGGTNEFLNLVTSCFECNRGKGKKELSDKTRIAKQANEIKLLEEKRWQFQLYKKYIKELSSVRDQELELLLEELDVDDEIIKSEVKKAHIKHGYFKVKEYYELWLINCELKDKNRIKRTPLRSYITKKENEKLLSPEERIKSYICGILYNRFGLRASVKFKTFFKERNFDIEDLEAFELALKSNEVTNPVQYWNDNIMEQNNT